MAALRVLAVRDAACVSTEELAAAAGASAALVYHYFGGKQGLVEAALNRAAEELMGLLVRDAEAHPAVQLDRSLADYLGFLAEHPASWSALLRAGAAREEPGATIARRVDDRAVALSCEALGAAGENLDRALRAWLDLVKGTCLRWLETGTPDAAELHSFLAAAFIGTVDAAAATWPDCVAARDALLGP